MAISEADSGLDQGEEKGSDELWTYRKSDDAGMKKDENEATVQ